MADNTNDQKLQDMQKYLPFLLTVIDKLQMSANNIPESPRTAQLQKMQMLHDLLTCKGKRLKLETLNKCENVLIKLAAKMEKRDIRPGHNPASGDSRRIDDTAGPASPPPQEMDEIQPVEIPTERRCSPVLHIHRPCEKSLLRPTSHHSERQRNSYLYDSDVCQPPKNISMLNSMKNNSQSLHNQSVDSSRGSGSDQYVISVGQAAAPFQRRPDRDNQRSRSLPDKNRNNTSMFERYAARNLSHHHKPISERQREHLDVVDLVSNSPSPTNDASDIRTHNRNPYQTTPTRNKERNSDRRVFQRLGEKIPDIAVNDFTNFKVNVANPCTQNRYLSDGLKNDDRSHIETGGRSNFTENTRITTISNQGNRYAQPIACLNVGNPNLLDFATRRAPKVDNKSSCNDLETVRKKLAMLSRSSPLPDILTAVSPLPIPPLLTEHYHQSAQSQLSQTSKSAGNVPSYLDPRMNKTPLLVNANVLPSINTHDPRLRKSMGAARPPLFSNSSPSPESCVNPSHNDPRLAIGYRFSDKRSCSLSESQSRLTPTTSKSDSKQSEISDSPRTSNKDLNCPRTSTKDLNSRNTPPFSRNRLGADDSHRQAQEFIRQSNLNERKATSIERREQQNSPEENWDSDSEMENKKKTSFFAARDISTIEKKQHKTQLQCRVAESNDARTCWLKGDTGKTASGGSATQGRINYNDVNNATATNNRFNAMLNDTTERRKYIASKKNKISEARTYAEFKAAKAQTAAENGRKSAINKSRDESSKKAVKFVEGSERNQSTESLPAKSTTIKPTESTLDKLYRGSNFNETDFAKTVSSFKIPKKQSAEKTDENFKNTEQVITVGIKDDCVKNTGKDSCSLQESSVVKDAGKVLKTDAQSEDTSTVVSTKKPKKHTRNKTDQQEQHSDISNKKITDKIKLKKQESLKSITVRTTVSDVQKDKNPQLNKSDVVFESAFITPGGAVLDAAVAPVPALVAAVTPVPALVAAVAPVPALVAAVAPVSGAPAVVDSVPAEPATAEPIAVRMPNVVTSTEKTATSKTSVIINGEDVMTEKTQTQKEKGKQEDHDPIGKQLLRITRRRATMIDFGSTPEIDKEKILRANALLFEDIQDMKKKEQIAQNELKQNIRRNKNLAEIFQKTDDNCTVSTQNILTGKRRTRPTINFNEVQQVKALFRHKITPEPKKNMDKEVGKVITKGSTKNKNNSLTPVLPNKAVESDITTEVYDTENNKADPLQSSTASRTTCTMESKALTSEIVNVSVAEGEPNYREKTEMEEPFVSSAKDSGKREMLEDFVQNMLKPNANKEFIFSLLKEFLTEEKLKMVRTIIDSVNTENESVSDEQSKFNKTANNQPTEGEKPDGETLATKPECKRRGRKRNELDRLNEDIRDMFISEGVITATGRRMCTLVEAATEERATIECKGNRVKGINKITRNKNSGNCLNVEIAKDSPRIRKAKVILNQIKVNDLRRSKRTSVGSISNIEEDASGSSLKYSSVELLSKTKMSKTGKVESKRKKAKVSSKNVWLKPCPKSKKKISQLKKQAVSKSNQVKSTKILVSKTACSEQDAADIEGDEMLSSAIMLKNTNFEWHSQSMFSRQCVICEMPQKSLSMHYKLKHNEHFSSRLPPTTLQLFKDGKYSKPLFCTYTKNEHWYFYRCPFCEKYKRTRISLWIMHLLTHAGEYRYECSKCKKCSQKRGVIVKHFEESKTCSGATILDNKLCSDYLSNKTVKAYVCCLCNFLQFTRANLDRHYKEQHDYDPKKIGSMGLSIDILDCNNVRLVEEAEADELERKVRSTEESGLCTDIFDEFVGKKSAKINKAENFKNDEISLKAITIARNDSTKTQYPRCAPRNDKIIVTPMSNTNAFMPSRDTTDSPTMENFAKSLSTIEQIEDQFDHAKPTIAAPISMAEKLSQRLKHAVNSQSQSENFPISRQNNIANDVIENFKLSNVNSPVARKLINTESESGIDDSAKDDENWEDIEITEVSPNTNTASKTAKNRNLLQKMNRFCTMSKMKKTLSVSGNKKKSKINIASEKLSVNSAASVESKSGSILNASPKIECANSNNNKLPEIIAFRPMITTLDDLLPDSPCNDPFELEPELAPIEPLQDLNDISSLLDSNFNGTELQNVSSGIDEPHIDKDSQLNIMEEALDFVNSQTAVTTDPFVGETMQTNDNGGIHAFIHRIQNVGYSLTNSDQFSQRFYCLSENCTFLYSTEAIELESHYLTEHLTVKWNGYCGTCNRQVRTYNEAAPELVSTEIRHMIECHISARKTRKFSDQQNEEQEERPRIKLRRLTGDCLSRTPTNYDDKANSEIPEERSFKNMESIPTRISAALLDMPLASQKNYNERMDGSSMESSSCGLQITSVVSLNTDAKKKMTLPKISNVCSLNDAISDSYHSNTECDAEVSRLMRNQNVQIGDNGATDSPGPIVVAETVPLAQAVSGDFVITQTVSAQYGVNTEGSTSTQLGFNISIAASSMATAQENESSLKSSDNNTLAPIEKTPLLGPYNNNPAGNKQSVLQRPHFVCKGNGCKYQTRLQVAMGDHLRFHERRNLSSQQEFLRCAQCNNLADDITDYFRHFEKEHLLVDSNTGQQDSSLSKNPEICRSLAATIKEMVSSTGIPDEKLYPCVVSGCKAVLTEANFTTHVVFHLTTLRQTNSMFKCPHCKSTFQRTSGLLSHIKSHACHTVFCYLCMASSTNTEQMLKHFAEKHWRPMSLNTYPIHEPKPTSNNDTGYAVITDQALNQAEVQRFAEKLVSDWQRKNAAFKTHFTGKEINLLPIHPIFSRAVNCAECQYRTKVRTNMMRHLQMHLSGEIRTGSGDSQSIVASVDPINPMPCLNTNERHFDKMTNLASSSVVLTNTSSSNNTGAASDAIDNAGISNIFGHITYGYVSDSKRFTCGVPGCKNLSSSEEIFRSHLSTLHYPHILVYQCVYCGEELCKRGLDIDCIINHLRYHSLNLYSCGECHYLHYMKVVVEKHIHEKHIGHRIDLITYTRDEENSLEGTITMQNILGKRHKDTTKSTKSLKPTAGGMSAKNLMSGTAGNTTTKSSGKSIYKWECCICGHVTATQNQMVSHCHSRHDKKYQFQCSYCLTFTAQQLSNIHNHITEAHPGSVKQGRPVFIKIVENNSSVDTRPLWQRDDPKRIRHIRGILMEDENESEQHCRSLFLEEDDSLQDAVNTVQNNTLTSLQSQVPAQVQISKPSPHQVASTNIKIIVQQKNTNIKESFSKVDEASKVSTVLQTVNEEELLCGRYWFGCFICDYKTTDLDALYERHWKQDHSDSKNIFLCRLLNRLKCPDCMEFTGCYAELRNHRSSAHKTRALIAADPNSRKNLCAFCNYNFTNASTLSKHHRRERHEQLDLKVLTTAQLNSMLGVCFRQAHHFQCMFCYDLCKTRTTVLEHIDEKHGAEKATFNGAMYEEIENTLLYGCPLCNRKGSDEFKMMRHMIDHFGGFNHCHFCRKDQVDFNGYIQHCYSEHREGISRFSSIYPLATIKQYLSQMFVIFPNGLVLNKKNLRYTQYGSETRMTTLYESICKAAKNPPIPRLSIGQLVARKSIEARHINGGESPSDSDCDFTSASSYSTSMASAMQLAGNGIAPSHAAQQMAKKILKRRSTVAFCSKEPELTKFHMDFGRSKSPKSDLESAAKKQRLSCTATLPSVPLFNSEIPLESSIANSVANGDSSTPLQITRPYSFYKCPVTDIPDMDKLYAKINIGGQEKTLSVRQLKLLFKLNCRVLVTDQRPSAKNVDNETRVQPISNILEINTSDDNNPYAHVKKPCPACHKHKYLSFGKHSNATIAKKK